MKSSKYTGMPIKLQATITPPRIWKLIIRFATKNKEQQELLWQLIGENNHTLHWLLIPSIYSTLSIALDLCSLYLLIPLTQALSSKDFNHEFLNKLSKLAPSSLIPPNTIIALTRIDLFWILFSLIIVTKILQTFIDHKRSNIISSRNEKCGSSAISYCTQTILGTSDSFLQRHWSMHAETIDGIPQLTKSTFAYIESAFTHTLRLILYVIVLLRIAPMAAVVTFCAFPVSASATMWFRSNLMARAKEQLLKAQNFRLLLRDTLEHSTLIKTNSKENWAVERIKVASSVSAQGQRAEADVAASFESFQGLTVLIFAVLVSIAVMIPTPDANHFASQLFLCFYLLSGSLPLASQLGRLRVSKDALQNKLEIIQKLINDAGSHLRLSENRPVPCIYKNIILSHVFYNYKNGVPVLEDATATFQANQVSFISGPSGAGKTTILNLISGVHAPQQGSIFLEDLDLSSLDLASYHEKISCVEQDPTLLLASMRENLLFGNPHTISDEEILEVLNELQLTDVVKSYPDGLDHIVDRGGRGLSRGQRQRFALVRAILKKPSLMLLDEPTTGLDPGNVRAFVTSLKKRCSNSTIILATHHLIPDFTPDAVWKVENHQLHKQE